MSGRPEQAAGAETKSLLGSILVELQEAGEEDACALLNTVMVMVTRARSSSGTGSDVEHYVDALRRLVGKRRVRLEEYRYASDGLVRGDVVDTTAIADHMRFDPRRHGAVKRS